MSDQLTVAESMRESFQMLEDDIETITDWISQCDNVRGQLVLRKERAQYILAKVKMIDALTSHQGVDSDAIEKEREHLSMLEAVSSADVVGTDE